MGIIAYFPFLHVTSGIVCVAFNKIDNNCCFCLRYWTLTFNFGYGRSEVKAGSMICIGVNM